MTKRYTPSQLRAINAPLTNLKIVGPSGSGKTTVLAQKVANLLAVEGETGILVLAPSPRISRGLQAWVGAIVGELARGPRFTCLSAIALEALRANAEELGLLRYFTTLDSRQQRRWIAAQVTQRYPHRSARDVTHHIVSLKAQGIDPHGYKKHPNFDADVHAIYTEYQQFLTDTQALDTEELIPLFVQLLRQKPTVAGSLATQYPVWVVDHLEDLTPLGLVALNMIGPYLRQLIVAGDPWVSQTQPHDPVATFGTAFQLVTLDLSHLAVDAPCRQVESWINGCHTQKTDRVSVVLTDGPDDEAAFIARHVRQAIKHRGVSPNDIAIIGPSDTYTVAIESQLRADGLRFRTVFGQGSPTYAPIRELMAYVRVIFNPADRLALAQVLALPPFQLDESEIALIVNHAQQARDGSVQFSDEGLVPSTKQKVVALVELITHFRQTVDDAPTVLAGLLLDQVADDAGIRDMLEDDNTIESIEQRQAIDELIVDITESEWTIDQLMDAIVITQLDDPPFESGSAITVTSADAARGEKFLYGIVCGVALGRVAPAVYRAATRSQSELLITVPAAASLASGWFMPLQSTSQWQSSQPELLSQFRSLGHDIEVIQPAGLVGGSWSVGESVHHSTWGDGAVLAVIGSGGQLMLDVAFADQTRRLVARYANLQRVS